MHAQKRPPAKTSKPPARQRPSAKRAEACRLLQVAPTADDELITQAYWHLARKYWANAAHDPEARQRLDDVNRAYLTLNPAQTAAPLSFQEPPPEQPPLMEEFTAWLRHAVDHTRARWLGRVPEIVTLTVTTALLAFLALTGGADSVWIVVVTGVALLTIWAPWRRL